MPKSLLIFSDFLHKSSLPILIYLLTRHAFALFERTTSRNAVQVELSWKPLLRYYGCLVLLKLVLASGGIWDYFHNSRFTPVYSV